MVRRIEKLKNNMSKRHQQNKYYSNCIKTKSPACCSINCCGTSFGVHNGRVKRLIRRYHRHATKNNWMREFEYEVRRAEEDILIICGFDEDWSDVLPYTAEYGNGY